MTDRCLCIKYKIVFCPLYTQKNTANQTKIFYLTKIVDYLCRVCYHTSKQNVKNGKVGKK